MDPQTTLVAQCSEQWPQLPVGASHLRGTPPQSAELCSPHSWGGVETHSGVVLDSFISRLDSKICGDLYLMEMSLCARGWLGSPPPRPSWS